MERCVKLWTNEGDTVLDFTMGSGTSYGYWIALSLLIAWYVIAGMEENEND